jgi:hypothetical protein
MSHRVLEVAIRKGGWQWMEKRERWHDSEVTMKKHCSNMAKGIDNKGQSEHDPLFWAQMFCMQKNKKYLHNLSMGTGGTWVVIS